MTSRMITRYDLVRNEADLKKTRELYPTLKNSDALVSLLVPWLPSPAKKVGNKATTDLHIPFSTYVERRRREEPTIVGSKAQWC